MKRILIFSLVYYPRFIGGAEVAIKEITDRISPSEIEFDMVTLRLDKHLPKYEKIGNVNVYRVGFAGDCLDSADSLRFPLKLNKYLLPFIGAWKARQLHAQKPYDATWAMMANYAGFAGLFFKWLRPEVAFLLTLQEGDPIPYIKKRVGLLYPIFRQIFVKADRVQAISQYLADFATEMGHMGKVAVVPNGVDVEHFAHRAPDIELTALKDALGKKYTDEFLVTTSRLVVKNAVGDIIRALALLPEQVKLLILGIGYQENALRALARELNVADRVQFLGHVPHAEMPKYLHISDVFVRPALSEGFGNSFIEAMAAGIPVVATPVGGIVDFLTSPEQAAKMAAERGKYAAKPATGLFCQVEDPKSIATQVKRLDDRVLRDALVREAKTMVVEKYDWSLVARNMKEFLGKV